MVEILIDSFKDVIRVVPLLFLIITLVNVIVVKLNQENKLFDRFAKYDCLGGAILGIIPQCGISVAFARLYSNGYITLGMLMAVFFASSDEALIIIGAHPEHLSLVLLLIALKLVIAVVAGYLINALIKEKRNRIKACTINCDCPKCVKHKNIFVSSVMQTLRIVGFLLITVFLLNLGLERFGEEGLYGLLGKNSFLQPIYAALIGAIPSCMSSVVLAEGYIQGAVSFGALIAGLLANTGYGILIVLRELDAKRALKVMGLLFFISIFIGEMIQLIGG